MNETPDVPETKWLPVLFVWVAGMLLFVLPQFLPFIATEWNHLSTTKHADDPRTLWEILKGSLIAIHAVLEGLLIRELMIRFGGWKKFLLFSVVFFVLGSIILAPPMYEIDFASTDRDGLMDAVSTYPPPTTWWWLLPAMAMHEFNHYAFLICFTELFFPHHRQRPWLSRGMLGVCGALTVALLFLEFNNEVSFKRGKVTLVAFSWAQAVLGAAVSIGILVYSLRNAPQSIQQNEKPDACPTPLMCAAGVFAFLCAHFFVSFTETVIASFSSGSWFFRNPLARTLRATADLALLIFAIRILTANVQKKGWGNRHNIGLLFGAYATTQIYNALGFNILGDMGPVFRWTSFLVNLAALLFAGFLFQWLWKHQPNVVPGPTTQ